MTDTIVAAYDPRANVTTGVNDAGLAVVSTSAGFGELHGYVGAGVANKYTPSFSGDISQITANALLGFRDRIQAGSSSSAGGQLSKGTLIIDLDASAAGFGFLNHSDIIIGHNLFVLDRRFNVGRNVFETPDVAPGDFIYLSLELQIQAYVNSNPANDVFNSFFDMANTLQTHIVFDDANFFASSASGHDYSPGSGSVSPVPEPRTTAMLAGLLLAAIRAIRSARPS